MLQRNVLTIAMLIGLSLITISTTGCKDNLLAPQTQFWGEVRYVSQYQKHVWVTTGTGPNMQTIMDKTMNPNDVWQAYLTGSQLYTVHWEFKDHSGAGSGDIRPNNVASDAGYSSYKMDWYVEIADGGISSNQP